MARGKLFCCSDRLHAPRQTDDDNCHLQILKHPLLKHIRYQYPQSFLEAKKRALKNQILRQGPTVWFSKRQWASSAAMPVTASWRGTWERRRLSNNKSKQIVCLWWWVPLICSKMFCLYFQENCDFEESNRGGDVPEVQGAGRQGGQWDSPGAKWATFSHQMTRLLLGYFPVILL